VQYRLWPSRVFKRGPLSVARSDLLKQLLFSLCKLLLQHVKIFGKRLASSFILQQALKRRR
jgi:hypothetical protein